MMKLSMILLVATLIVSCTRDPNSANNNVPPIGDGTLQYKVNGNLVTVKNISIADGEYVMFAKHLPSTLLDSTIYLFSGVKGVNNSCVLGIVSDSLTVGNYAYDSTAYVTVFNGVIYNGVQSGIFYSGDHININITSYSNGYISGNFTAKITPEILDSNGVVDYSKKGTTLITEGEFKNIKCIY